MIPPCDPEKFPEETRKDPGLSKQCQKATNMMAHVHQEKQCDKLRDELLDAPTTFHDVPFHDVISKNTPVNAMRKEAERMLS